MNTKQTVYKMLIENTGKHLLDSGGDSGRMWQRNQKKTVQDFENEPGESYEFDFNGGYIYRTLSVFHYLTNNLQIDDLCKDFNNLQNDSNNWDSNCNLYGVSAEAYEILDTLPDVRILRTWNTYNGESDLSQIIQGATIEINEETYFCIQIHGGADARGGYTNAKLFKSGSYCDGMIHEYLLEYKDSSEIEQDLEEGYIETFTDYLDESITYTIEEVNKRIKEINQ